MNWYKLPYLLKSKLICVVTDQLLYLKLDILVKLVYSLHKQLIIPTQESDQQK